MFSDTYQERNVNSMMLYHFGLHNIETFATLFAVSLDILIVD